MVWWETQLKFTSAEDIQISSTLSNWELDGLIALYSTPEDPVAEKSRAGGKSSIVILLSLR